MRLAYLATPREILPCGMLMQAHGSIGIDQHIMAKAWRPTRPQLNTLQSVHTIRPRSATENTTSYGVIRTQPYASMGDPTPGHNSWPSSPASCMQPSRRPCAVLLLTYLMSLDSRLIVTRQQIYASTRDAKFGTYIPVSSHLPIKLDVLLTGR